MPATVTLPALLALYKLDRELHTLQVGLENVQREQKRQQAKIAELTRGIDAQQTTTQKLQADINIRELDLQNPPATYRKAPRLPEHHQNQ